MAEMLDTPTRTPPSDRLGGSESLGGTNATEPAGTSARRPYQPPVLSLRGSVLSGTLVSGDECNFDPPPC